MSDTPEVEARPAIEVSLRDLAWIAASVHRCATSWVPEARLVGNVTARELETLSLFVLRQHGEDAEDLVVLELDRIDFGRPTARMRDRIIILEASVRELLHVVKEAAIPLVDEIVDRAHVSLAKEERPRHG